MSGGHRAACPQMLWLSGEKGLILPTSVHPRAVLHAHALLLPCPQPSPAGWLDMPGKQHLGCLDALNDTPISWICSSVWVQGIEVLVGPGQRHKGWWEGHLQPHQQAGTFDELPLARRAPRSYCSSGDMQKCLHPFSAQPAPQLPAASWGGHWLCSP